jgi:CxxC motif-containing protein (DUF1111 family)
MTRTRVATLSLMVAVSGGCSKALVDVGSGPLGNGTTVDSPPVPGVPGPEVTPPGPMTPGAGGADSCAKQETVSPLFQPSAASPGFEVMPSGAIKTFGAGRVRGRHENEGEFSKFHERYFELRSFEFTVEDTIPAGGNTIKFTWAPEHRNNGPNFRVFYTGDGNIFMVNVIMREEALPDGKFVYVWEIDRNQKLNRALQKGDAVEFEFGVFLAAPIEGRTNYYTDTYRYRVGEPGLKALDTPDAETVIGGATTTHPIVVEKELSFEQHALNLRGATLRSFLKGRRMFHTRFDNGEHTEGMGPAVTELATTAGPLLNQVSCSSCHVRDGRGAPPANANDPLSTVVIKLADGVETTGAPIPHARFGRQLQPTGLAGVTAEGQARVAYAEIPATFADGTVVMLQQPKYTFTSGGIEKFSPRVARQLVGMGLLEAVDETTVLQRQDSADCNKDGISGVANLVFDPESKSMKLGRFGWKAGKASVKHQVSEALMVDHGVTTSLFPLEDCGAQQADCTAARKAGPAEMSDEKLGDLVNYMRTLAVPARRDVANPVVKRGEALFNASGCGSCHMRTMLTGDKHPVAELRGQQIQPFTDLLVHDMGELLADTTAGEFRASNREWRTPPLWGIGMVETVNGHTRFLHDGRARNLLEAVLWHGGEAGPAKGKVLQMGAEDRDALVAFLKSL